MRLVAGAGNSKYKMKDKNIKGRLVANRFKIKVSMNSLPKILAKRQNLTALSCAGLHQPAGSQRSASPIHSVSHRKNASCPTRHVWLLAPSRWGLDQQNTGSHPCEHPGYPVILVRHAKPGRSCDLKGGHLVIARWTSSRASAGRGNPPWRSLVAAKARAVAQANPFRPR